MSSERLLIGIDVGTTSCKVCCMDGTRRVIAQAGEAHPLSMPRPQWSEQDPEDWVRSAIAATRRVLAAPGVDPQRVAAVCLAGQMHGLTLLNASGDVLRPCILWNDQRTGPQCAEITRRVGPQRVIQLTGNQVLTGFTAPKLLWVREHEPAVYARVARVLLPKDYVAYRLSGAFFTDVADASGTSLFDVAARNWSDEMLATLEVPRAWLASVFESGTPVASLSAEAAQQIGLRAGTPLIAGAGDQAAQAVGAGIVQPGQFAVTVGTSGVVFAACDALCIDPLGRLHAFCHAVPGMWHLMGVTLSAGGSFEWLCELMQAAQQLSDTGRPQEAQCAARLGQCAGQAPVGSEGLLFLPYLTGERTPHADPHARGAWVGLTRRHGLAHLARSVMEGVAYALRDSLHLLHELGVRPAGLPQLSGGAAESPVWRQIITDVLGHPLQTPSARSGAALGAALLAGVGAGVWPSARAAAALGQAEGEVTSPVVAAVRQYDQGYERFRLLYPALKRLEQIEG